MPFLCSEANLYFAELGSREAGTKTINKMKRVSFWSVLMPVMMLSATFAFSSCGGGDDDEPTILDPIGGAETDSYEVAGTRWESLATSSSGYSMEMVLSFSTNTAVLTMTEQVPGTGNEVISRTRSITYRYQRSRRLVVLTPQEAGMAVIEGRIDESGIKMTLTNSGNEVGVLYKK